MNHHSIKIPDPGGDTEIKKGNIEWVDIYKAITIILVVIGHSTGYFNKYIYQFHMAAFFFISGYVAVTAMRRDNLWRIVVKKFRALIVPLIAVFVLFLVLVEFLRARDVLELLIQQPLPDYLTMVKSFLFDGIMYIPWLGAGWFLAVLFGVFVIQKALMLINLNRANVPYFFMAVLLFAVGYGFVHTGNRSAAWWFTWDLIFIAQFYFAVGMVSRKVFSGDHLRIRLAPGLIWLVLSVMIFWYFGNVNINTVDYPSRNFGNIVYNALAGMNGMFFLILISFFLTKLPQALKRPLLFLGKNTLAVLCFHFLMFKLTTLGLHIAHIADASSFGYLTPPEGLNQYWYVYVPVSIVSSVGIWVAAGNLKGFLVIKIDESFFISKHFQNGAIVIKKAISSGRIKKGLDILAAYRGAIRKQIFVSWNKAKQLVGSYTLIAIALGLLIVVVALPFLRTGIIVNDELNWRFMTNQGWASLFTWTQNISSSQGRILGILPWAISNYLNFAIDSQIYYGLIRYSCIIINLVLFAVFLHKLYGNTGFSVFTSLCLLITIPITFEHAMPNAFAIFSMTFSAVLLSFLFYIHYLRNNKQKYAWLSAILFFLSCCGYEAFVMMAPMFLVLNIRFQNVETNIQSVSLAAKKLMPPVISALLYLSLYFIFSQAMPSNYGGNQLLFASFRSTFAIIKQLFLSSVPGYFLSNSNYSYLYVLYGEAVPFSGSILAPIQTFLYTMFSARMLAFLILLLVVFFHMQKNSLLKSKNNFGIPDLAVGIILTILLAVPNSLAASYQGIVNDHSFMALPVSYLMMFGTVFSLSFIVWKIGGKLPAKYWGVVLACVLFLSLPIQSMNDIFSWRQNENFNNLKMTEEFFDEGAVRQIIAGQTVSAPDLYKTRDSLAIHDGYWTQYVRGNGTDSDIDSASYGTNPIHVSFDGQRFSLSRDNYRLLFSKIPLPDPVPIQTGNDTFTLAQPGNIGALNKYYCYAFELAGGVLSPLDVSNELLWNVSLGYGTTLRSAGKVYGYSPDGWVEAESKFKISAGPEGKITITGYWPGDMEEGLTGMILINDVPRQGFVVEEPNFTIAVDVGSNEQADVTIQCDFVYEHDLALDPRTFCFILSDIVGE
jgi:fucose 4-O-acetylase-like acetyltransferase